MRLYLSRHPSILATLAVVLALMLHGAMVGAEERDLTTSPYLRVDETLPLLALGSAIDIWTTERAFRIDPSLREWSPAGQSVGERAAIHFAILGAGTYAVHATDRRYGRKWGKRMLWLLVGIHTAAAVNNVAKARR